MELQGGQGRAASTARTTGSLGPRILQLCAEVEADFWDNEGHLEEPPFGAAVVQLDAENESFQESYTKLMKDLEVQLPRLGTETTLSG